VGSDGLREVMECHGMGREDEVNVFEKENVEMKMYITQTRTVLF
jgi:hypothetical protein